MISDKLRRMAAKVNARTKMRKDSLKTAKKQFYKAKAQQIVNRVPARAEKAAAKGQHEIVVLVLKHRRDHDNFPNTAMDAGENAYMNHFEAKGLALVVWDMLITQKVCRESEIEVRPEHDGVGMSSWFTMYFTWAKKPTKKGKLDV